MSFEARVRAFYTFPFLGYTLETLVHEWLYEFAIAGVEEKVPMGVLERKRIDAGQTARPWRNPKLRTEVLKRSSICEHVQRIAASQCGGHEPHQIAEAIEIAKEQARKTIRESWTLRSLYMYLNGYTDKPKKSEKSDKPKKAKKRKAEHIDR